MSRERILLVEDDFSLSFIIKRMLESKEYEVVTAESVDKAVHVMESQGFELILLDMMLPDGMGTELCEKIRRKSFCPIIFISCLDDSATKIEALKMGGDDYITKPINFEELITRIQVNIRRARQYNLGRSPSNEEHYPGILIKKDCHELWLTDAGEQPATKVELSPIEYQILNVFVEKPGQLLLYEEIYQKVWGADDLGDIRTVMVHVSNLRKKLGDSGKELIHTVRGAGYIFGIQD